MVITPSEVPRYLLRTADLVTIDLATGKIVGMGKRKRKPSIEHNMHRQIDAARPDANAVVHTHSPYTIAVAISGRFRHVIEEARIVVGEQGPAVIENRPSGSAELADAVAAEFVKGARAVVIKNHGVVAAGQDIHHARAVVEALEEWAKVLAVARMLGGQVVNYLD
jgi:ribulose-5-phosphate 4-epimerase/fuculose-1-phosphate aldolase